jgi:hypothetical protein
MKRARHAEEKKDDGEEVASGPASDITRLPLQDWYEMNWADPETKAPDLEGLFHAQEVEFLPRPFDQGFELLGPSQIRLFCRDDTLHTGDPAFAPSDLDAWALDDRTRHRVREFEHYQGLLKGMTERVCRLLGEGTFEALTELSSAEEKETLMADLVVTWYDKDVDVDASRRLFQRLWTASGDHKEYHEGVRRAQILSETEHWTIRHLMEKILQAKSARADPIAYSTAIRCVFSRWVADYIYSPTAVSRNRILLSARSVLGQEAAHKMEQQQTCLALSIVRFDGGQLGYPSWSLRYDLAL